MAEKRENPQNLSNYNQSSESITSEYAIGIDEPVTQLDLSDLWTLCEILCKNGSAYGIFLRLVKYLGVTADRNSDKKEFPEEMFRMIESWAKRKGSTIRVLIRALEHLQRPDCVKYVKEEALCKFTHLVIILHVMESGGKEWETEQLKYDAVPERMPFDLWIRPIIQDYVISSSARALNRLNHLAMKKLDDLIWTSLCKNYAGRQIDLYLYHENKHEKAIKSAPANDELSAMSDNLKGFVFEYNQASRHSTTVIKLALGYYHNNDESLMLNRPQDQEHSTLLIRNRTELPDSSTNQLEDSYNLDRPTSKQYMQKNRINNKNPSTDEGYSEDQNLDLASSNPMSPDEDIISLHSDYAHTDYTPYTQLNQTKQELNLHPGSPGSALLNLSSLMTDQRARARVMSSSIEQPNGGKEVGYFTVTSFTDSPSIDEEWIEVSKLKGFHDLQTIESTERRNVAKKIIQTYYRAHKTDGCYLIRPSQSGAQRFTLTFGSMGHVYDISIVNKDGRYFLFDRVQVTKSSIRDLIEYYKAHSINGSVKLTVPVTSSSNHN